MPGGSPSRPPAEPDAAVGQGLVVEAGVVDPLVVLVAQRDRVGQVGAAAVGPGSSVVELAPGVGAFAAGGGAGVVFESFGEALGLGEESALAAEVEGDGRLPRTAGRMPALQARRRASPAERVWSVSRRAAFRAPVRTVWSMVTTTVAAVLVCRWSVGRCSRSSANASPRRWRQSKDRSAAVVGAGSRIRRGAVIASMILPSIAAARAGMVKCPVVVPSPLSCRVSEHLSRAACSSVRTSSFSWASTTFWSGSTVSIARRASRRSWSGLNRAAFSTSAASTALALLRRSPRGSWPVARTITAAWSGETRPASRASAVASCPESQFARQRDLAGCVGAGHGGGLGQPGVGTGEPGVLGDTRPESAAATSLSLRPPVAGSLGPPPPHRCSGGANQQESSGAGRSMRAGPRPQPTPHWFRGGGRGVLP